MSFNIEVLGYKKFDEKTSSHWLEVRVWVDFFSQRVQVKGDMDIRDFNSLIKWLREPLSRSEPVKSFQTFYEPLLTITAEPSESSAFEVTTLISALGWSPDYGEDEGLALRFSTDKSSMKRFADELESELKATDIDNR